MQVVEAPVSTNAAGRAEDVYARLEKYLLALGFQNQAARGQALAIIQERAERRVAVESSRPRDEVLGQELEKTLGEWHGRVFPESHLGGSAREKMALLLADIPAESQHLFFQPGPIPPELQRAARQDLRLHPNLQRAAMVPQPLDLGPITILTGRRANVFFRAITGVAWIFGLILVAVFLFEHL